MTDLGPYSLDTIVVGDCLDVMRAMPDGCVDVVVTDPPYGCGKADWDDDFPTAWYVQAKRIARTVLIITGSCGLRDSVALVGTDFVDVIAGRNLNGMTRGPLGFGNWLAAVVAGDKPRQGVNFLEFAVVGEMPDHPSPKPLQYMVRLMARVTDEGDLIFDPFMGSGTTAVAAKKLGRHYFGCDISEDYVKMARERVAKIDGVQMPLSYTEMED